MSNWLAVVVDADVWKHWHTSMKIVKQMVGILLSEFSGRFCISPCVLKSDSLWRLSLQPQGSVGPVSFRPYPCTRACDEPIGDTAQSAGLSSPRSRCALPDPSISHRSACALRPCPAPWGTEQNLWVVGLVVLWCWWWLCQDQAEGQYEPCTWRLRPTSSIGHGREQRCTPSTYQANEYRALWLVLIGYSSSRYPLVCKTQWTRARVITFQPSSDQVIHCCCCCCCCCWWWCRWLLIGLVYTKTIIHLSVSE